MTQGPQQRAQAIGVAFKLHEMWLTTQETCQNKPYLVRSIRQIITITDFRAVTSVSAHSAPGKLNSKWEMYSVLLAVLWLYAHSLEPSSRIHSFIHKLG